MIRMEAKCESPYAAVLWLLAVEKPSAIEISMHPSVMARDQA